MEVVRDKRHSHGQGQHWLRIVSLGGIAWRWFEVFNEIEYGWIEVRRRPTKYWLRSVHGTACRWDEADDCRRRMRVTRNLTHLHPHADVCHLVVCVVFGLVGCRELEWTPAQGVHWLGRVHFRPLPCSFHTNECTPVNAVGAVLSAGRRIREQAQDCGLIKSAEAAKAARTRALGPFQHDNENTRSKRAWEGSGSCQPIHADWAQHWGRKDQRRTRTTQRPPRRRRTKKLLDIGAGPT